MKEAEDPPKQGSDAEGGGGGGDDDLPDADPESIVSSKAQFADLHNRLQGLNHHISSVYRSHHDFTRVSEQRHAELSGQIDDLRKFLQLRMDKLDTLDQRVGGLEREVKDLRSELARKIKDSEMAVKGHVGDQHQNLAETVKAHAAPGHGRLIFVIIVGQLLLVGGYVVYKRRKSSPKKYL
jgi:mannose-binding lectin 1